MENSNWVKLFELAYNGKILETSKQHKTVSCDSTKVKLSEFNLCPKIGLRAVGLQWFKISQMTKKIDLVLGVILYCVAFFQYRGYVKRKSYLGLHVWLIDVRGKAIMFYHFQQNASHCVKSVQMRSYFRSVLDWIQENTDQK